MEYTSAEPWEARIAALEAELATEQGGATKPLALCALAEAYRRTGRLEQAEQRARRAFGEADSREPARAVLALVLLDAGRGDEARVLLAERALELLETAGGGAEASVAPELGQDEIEAAFADAETDREQLIDPDRVAAEAAERVLPSRDLQAGLEEVLPGGSPFATRSMAELLERQGDLQGASRIRASLAESPGPEAAPTDAESPSPERPEPPEERRRRRTLATLEHWLHNLRGMQA